MNNTTSGAALAHQERHDPDMSKPMADAIRMLAWTRWRRPSGYPGAPMGMED